LPTQRVAGFGALALLGKCLAGNQNSSKSMIINIVKNAPSRMDEISSIMLIYLVEID
jgi:hypothetical protein